LENWFEIGVIVKPQGINGEVRVLPTTDAPERFALLDEVHIRFKKVPVPGIMSFKLISSRQHKGLVLIKFAGVNDRNTAETMVGGVLVIPPEKAIPLDTDEYFIRDLIGLQVQTEDKQLLGEVADVFSTGANDVYVVRNGDGSFMIPAIKDVVLDVSLPKGRMTVRLIEGLQELKT